MFRRVGIRRVRALTLRPPRNNPVYWNRSRAGHELALLVSRGRRRHVMRIKHAGAICVACGISLALAGTSPPHRTHAQSADLVLCDRIAADPADPDKPADVKGTAEIAPSDIATALRFCKIASA